MGSMNPIRKTIFKGQKCGCGWKGDLGTFTCIGRVFFLKLGNGWGVQVCNIIIISVSCLKQLIHFLILKNYSAFHRYQANSS